MYCVIPFYLADSSVINSQRVSVRNYIACLLYFFHTFILNVGYKFVTNQIAYLIIKPIQFD